MTAHPPETTQPSSLPIRNVPPAKTLSIRGSLLLAVISLVALPSAWAVDGTTPQLPNDSLPPLEHGDSPRNFEELWSGYDPRKEPLDIEVLKEWEDDEVVMRVVRYRIGVFKGRKSMMAAVYGFPKGARKLPGLVQIHGGGQYADSNAVFTNAKRGYATISISWAGRINAPDYRVSPDVVKLYWEGATDNPAYKVTTDWGALDGYHAPCRNPKNNFAAITPAPWTLDSVESPRNNPWFIITLGARRALTFLEQQTEVDPNRLGVYGHSMGGKLTVLTTAADSRVKASAPSCGGISDRPTDNALYAATIADDMNLKRISCPIIFLSPSNDFHGRIDDLQKAVDEIRSKQWRITCSPHHNHQDTAEYEVATQLWFDQYLKKSFHTPSTPGSALTLQTTNGIPIFKVTPDPSRTISSVDVYYTCHGKSEGEAEDMQNTIARFWHHAEATRSGDSWAAELPLHDADHPLWVYANVTYSLKHPVTGAGYYYRTYSTNEFVLSSRMRIATPEQLKEAGVMPVQKPSLTIESFEGDWEKQWFTYRPEKWARHTHKVYDARWKAPAGASLALEIRSEKPNKMVVGIDKHAAEIELQGGAGWQSVELPLNAFKDAAGAPLTSWTGIKELRLAAEERLVSKTEGKDQVLSLGSAWQGPNPTFKNLRWMTSSQRTR